MVTLLQMYITLATPIFAGILNMIWCTTSYGEAINKPIDNGKIWKDGKPIFGMNKTWKGFFGMIFFGMISSIIWGFVCRKFDFLEQNNYFYYSRENTLLYNAFIGALTGFAYVLLELPNSFIKRRLEISPGKSGTGLKSILFFILDQVDSIFGTVGVVTMFYPMSISFYLIYVFFGALTHIIINIFLYAFRLRKNIF